MIFSRQMEGYRLSQYERSEVNVSGLGPLQTEQEPALSTTNRAITDLSSSPI